MDEQSWHDRESVVMVAGVAAFALLGLLAFAVIRMSDDATEPAQFVAPVASTTTSAPTVKTVTATTSYAVPSVQTSEYTPPPVTSSVAPPGPGDVTAGPSSTPSTIFNPYATTTQPNAGHV